MYRLQVPRRKQPLPPQALHYNTKAAPSKPWFRAAPAWIRRHRCSSPALILSGQQIHTLRRLSVSQHDPARACPCSVSCRCGEETSSAHVHLPSLTVTSFRWPTRSNRCNRAGKLLRLLPQIRCPKRLLHTRRGEVESGLGASLTIGADAPLCGN